VQDAAKQEIIRRYFRYSCEYMLGLVEKDAVERVDSIMKKLKIKQSDRRVVSYAQKAAKDSEKSKKGNEGIYCGAAIELKNSNIVTGKNSSLMHATSSLILNAIKVLAGMPDRVHLLSPSIIKSIAKLKKDISNEKTVSLDLEETLIALSISATTNPTSKMCMQKLKELSGCEVHITHIPTPGDEAGLRRLGVNLTTDPNFSTNSLFVS
jgi:uncharacterized protein (UPF0371 family)